MRWRRRSVEDLRARLQEVDSEVAAHPLRSERVIKAFGIVEAEGGSAEADVERRLREEGLPSLEELGRIQLAGTATWWSLHRRRKKIVAKLERRTGNRRTSLD